MVNSTLHDPQSNSSESWLSGLIIAGFVVIGLLYSFIVPIFETPDEIYHYAFARHLSQGNGLPVQSVDADGPWAHEGTQAPLYYVLLGRLISGIDQNDFEQLAQINPRANLGDPLYPGNKNFMLYSAQQRPLRNTNLAVHIGRWFSLLLSSFTLVFVYATARLAFPDTKTLPLITLATVAAVPQFGFISASVTNDTLIILVSTASLYWLARLITKPASAPIAWWEWAILGGLLGLAALSKLQGLGLFPLTVIGLGLLYVQRKDWLLLFKGSGWIFVVALLIAGWWYWRNFTLYGEWLGVNQLLSIEGLRTESQTLDSFWGELRGLRYSFWGVYGWFSILLPNGVYIFLDLISLLAFVGALFAFGVNAQTTGIIWPQDPTTQVRWLMLVWALMISGLMLYWATFATSSQGRLLFPAISSFGILFVLGLNFWLTLLTRSPDRRALAFVPVGLLLCSIYVLAVVLPDVYSLVQPVTAIPVDAKPVGKVYGDGLELVAVQVPDQRFRPGEDVSVTLIMRKLAEQPRDYELFIQLLDNNNIQIGNVTSHPGWGIHPLSLWELGSYYADTYFVQVVDTIDQRSPLLARIYVGFIDPESDQPESEGLLPVQGGGPKIDSRTVGYVEIVPASSPNLRPLDMRSVQVNWGDVIRMTGYRFVPTLQTDRPRKLSVSLFWEASDITDVDYTGFVHLVGPTGEFIATYDQPPAEGRFPTSRWQPGDVSLSEFPISVPAGSPPGDYEVWVGLYRSDSSGRDRLPVIEADRPIQDNRVLLGTVQIR